MKLLGKQVQYFGMDITITSPFVAVDKNGDVYSYASEPILGVDGWIAGGICDFVVAVDLEGKDWKETLVDYSHLFKKNKKGSH